MPLFECTECRAVDNTALSEYWGQQMDHFEKVGDIQGFKPKCSQCFTGKWHGEFPRSSSAGMTLNARGFLDGNPTELLDKGGA